MIDNNINVCDNDDVCETCPHQLACIKEYGEYREDGDDYRAVVGTHHCRRSWDQFYDDMKCKKSNSEK